MTGVIRTFTKILCGSYKIIQLIKRTSTVQLVLHRGHYKENTVKDTCHLWTDKT